MSRKLKSIAEFGKEILDEVKYIQLSKTRNEFDEVNTIFYVKWLSLGSEKVDSFIDYYHKQWASSGESNWFAGVSIIDINNGLGAINKDMKVLRFSVIDKQKVGSSIVYAFIKTTQGSVAVIGPYVLHYTLIYTE